MTGNAALLIDLENFFLGREANVTRSGAGDSGYDVQSDLELLSVFARDMAGSRRLVVQRAYANFNVRRPNVHAGPEGRRFDYYLQHTPSLLMELGIEPIQVFNFPGGHNKNAADMRVAMDATALVAPPSNVDFFVFVTGDADFIRLGLELRGRGAEVAAIGIRGSTKRIFQRYFDHFEFFEDLAAAREVGQHGAPGLADVRAVLATVLRRNRPIQLAAVKPLLTAGLGRPFDPTQHDCESTEEFLRENAAALGIELRTGPRGGEVDLAGGRGAPDGGLQSIAASAAPSGDDNGSTRGAPQGHGAAGVASDTPRADATSTGPHAGSGLPEPGAVECAGPASGLGPPRAAGATNALPSPTAVAALARPAAAPVEVHSVSLYRGLLRRGYPKLHLKPYADWLAITAQVFAHAAGAGDGSGRPIVFHRELLDEVSAACAEAGVEEAGKKVNDVLFHLFKSSCFLCAEEGDRKGSDDFHWTLPAQLDPALTDVEALRGRALRFVLGLLGERLRAFGYGGTPRPELLAEMIHGPEPLPEQVATMAALAAPQGEPVREPL